MLHSNSIYVMENITRVRSGITLQIPLCLFTTVRNVLTINYCIRTLTRYSRIKYMDQCITKQVLHVHMNSQVSGHIDQTLVCSLHVLLNCEIDGLDGYAITNSMDLALRAHLFYNALVHVIYSRVSGQYSHAIKVNIEH